jgi:hypothetical protein
MKKIFFYTIIFCSVFGLPAAERFKKLASLSASEGRIRPKLGTTHMDTDSVILSLIDRMPLTTDAKLSIRIESIENNDINNPNKRGLVAEITDPTLEEDRLWYLAADFFLHADFSTALTKHLNQNTEVSFQVVIKRDDLTHPYFFSMSDKEAAKKLTISSPEKPIFSAPSNNSFGSFSVSQAIIFTIIPITIFFLGYWCALHHSSLENFFKKNITPI